MLLLLLLLLVVRQAKVGQFPRIQGPFITPCSPGLNRPLIFGKMNPFKTVDTTYINHSLSKLYLGGGFKKTLVCLLNPLLAEKWIQFKNHDFSDGLVQTPTHHPFTGCQFWEKASCLGQITSRPHDWAPNFGSFLEGKSMKSL